MTDAELLARLLNGACEVDERLLEALLAEGVPAPVALRRATRSPWHLGAALLLGSALALGAARPAAAQGGDSTAAPAALIAVAEPAAVVAVAPAVVVDAAPMATPSATEVAAPGLAEMSLEAGLVLLVPGLEIEAQQGTTPVGQLYTVVSGDTLSGIALRFYGNASLWNYIYNANTNVIANPHLIYPGQTFSIPPTPAVGIYVPPGSTVTPGSNPGNQTGRGAGPYTVRPGDSLWSIAQFAYGDPLRWSDIYNNNTAVIGANPGLIFSGTVLNLP